jgi:hypothetical protein
MEFSFLENAFSRRYLDIFMALFGPFRRPHAPAGPLASLRNSGFQDGE